ncbi:MlaC/ttg2D family ABC transporter substrate-binding protein [Neisseria weaveri]|uniref:Periplasmic transport protein n=1 Tax=Neisseria weaveri TaxID=28091 RepID=A0A3S5F9R7_9NEIS|nr:ABC transporter substrate-binding protein [Neisseria weaveri]EGV36806.1 toluene tolerance family protein [Neisseria weaveri LMG 5135]EGV37288.1 toluene tolerance family protein [Neisseria weaveri ATCC 51223]VEJ51209.1 Periplasmic transport protein [Neisseria weaveri]
MKKTAFITALSIGVLSIGLAAAAPSDAVNQIRENSVQVLGILKNANGSNDNAVRRKAENYALPYFDFERMTALAIGNPWRKATAEQKQALTKEFQTLLIRTYSGTMLKFKNAKVVIKDQPVVKNNGKEVVVSVEITNPGSKPVNMAFTTYQDGSRYRVYNVAVEGGSLVTVYRNQFNQTISQKGINGLVDELKAKNGSK